MSSLSKAKRLPDRMIYSLDTNKKTSGLSDFSVNFGEASFASFKHGSSIVPEIFTNNTYLDDGGSSSSRYNLRVNGGPRKIRANVGNFAEIVDAYNSSGNKRLPLNPDRSDIFDDIFDQYDGNNFVSHESRAGYSIPKNLTNYNYVKNNFDTWTWSFGGSDYVHLTGSSDFVHLSDGSDTARIEGDTWHPWGGNDYVFGGDGIDWMILPGKRSDYSVRKITFSPYENNIEYSRPSQKKPIIFEAFTKNNQEGILYLNSVENLAFVGEEEVFSINDVAQSETSGTQQPRRQPSNPSAKNQFIQIGVHLSQGMNR